MQPFEAALFLYIKINLSYSFQKDGENNTKTVKSSSRPRSIKNERNHFAKSGKAEKFSIGPISLNLAYLLLPLKLLVFRAQQTS